MAQNGLLFPCFAGYIIMIGRFGPKCSYACLAIFCGALKKAKTTTTTVFLAEGSNFFGCLFRFGVWGVPIYYKKNTLELPVGCAKLSFWAGGSAKCYFLRSRMILCVTFWRPVGLESILCVMFGVRSVSKAYCA